MVALVSVETVLLVLVVVLLVGLLRSHAELLRRVGDGEVVALPRTPPPRIDQPAPTIAGVTPSGDPVALAFDGGGATLLAFLTSGCSTCAGFWAALGEPRLPAGIEKVIIARGADRERPSKLSALAPHGVQVVMSSQAWDDFGVPGAPYFILVDGAIRGEGVATTWEGVASLVGEANGERGIDELFAARGIGPDDPSLRPG
jgi:hypothetical protein